MVKKNRGIKPFLDKYNELKNERKSPSLEEANDLLVELYQKHYLLPPYTDYVKLGHIPLRSQKEYATVLYPKIKDKKDLEGIVAFVNVTTLPPEHIRLFTDYKGLKLFYVKWDGNELEPQ
jgi:hypothetical protein